MAVKSTLCSNFFTALMMVRDRASAQCVLSCDVSDAGVYSDMAARWLCCQADQELDTLANANVSGLCLLCKIECC